MLPAMLLLPRLLAHALPVPSLLVPCCSCFSAQAVLVVSHG